MDDFPSKGTALLQSAQLERPSVSFVLHSGNRFEDMLKLREENKSMLSQMQKINLPIPDSFQTQSSAKPKEPKVIGKRPAPKPKANSSTALQDATRPKAFKRSSSAPRVVKKDYPTYSRGSDPSIAVEGTFMDQKPPVRSSTREEEALRKRYVAYQNKKRKSHSDLTRSPIAGRRRIVPPETLLLIDIFRQLRKKQSYCVTWEQLWTYLHNHRPEADKLGIAELTERSDYAEVLSEALGCKLDDSLHLDELEGLIDLLKTPQPVVAAKKTRPKKKVGNQKPKHILLSDDILDAIFGAFKEIDEHSENNIIREDFLNAVGAIDIVSENMDEVVVALADGDCTLESVLKVIEDEGDSQEYLTLPQLYTYFYYNYVPPADDPEAQESLNKILLEGDLRTIYSVFARTPAPNEPDATLTDPFLRSLLEDQEYAELRGKTAREPKGLSKYPTETFAELLNRIRGAVGKTLTWNVLLAYMTTRGVPLIFEQQEEEEEEEEEQEASNNEEGIEDAGAEKAVSDLCDSDLLRSEATSEPILEKPTNTKPLTVAKAPSFMSRKSMFKGGIAHSKFVQMMEEHSIEQMQELDKKFKANELNPALLAPKFAQMMEDEKSKRIENHRKLQEELLQSLNPPSFAEKGIRKDPPHAPAPQSPFRAQEVPMTSKVYMMDALREQEEERKIRIAQNAEALLESAQLPPRMAAEPRKIKLALPRAKNRPIFKAKSVPNFALMHSKLNKQLKKVRSEDMKTVFKPFNLSSSRKPCRIPTPNSAPPSRTKPTHHISAVSKPKAKEMHDECTVINEMKTQSINQFQRDALITEIEEVFTKETNKRTAKLEAALDAIFKDFKV